LEQKISEKNVTFAPLKYGATKVEMHEAQKLDIPGVTVDVDQGLVYANPEEINQSLLDSFSRQLGVALHLDPKTVKSLLRSRPLRYVPVMRQLPPTLSRQILEAKTESAKKALEESKKKPARQQGDLDYPLRSVALISEHWRYYPDTTIASHVIGFLNVNQEPQYGIERIFNTQLRGQKGSIRAVSDPNGGQILRPEQQIDNPKDGDTLVLTLDRTVQKEVETILKTATDKFLAESAQAIVMDPFTGRIIAMANTPLFDSNKYTDVYEKEPITIGPDQQSKITVELFDPETNVLVVRAYRGQVFTASGRLALTPKTRESIEALEKLYDLHDLARYYNYIGDNLRREVFPTDKPDVWLAYKNNLGLGAYLNRTTQAIYEPGSVMKPLIMAIGIDQGEITPSDTYSDTGPVLVDNYPIDNNDHLHYGRVNMTNCLEFSINTCMTSISFKLGGKLLYGALQRLGFGQITGIELEDELAGEIPTWHNIPRSTLATLAFGQGISATPLQVITAWSALANGGKLIKPTIIDSVLHEDGTVEKPQPKIIDQVFKPETSETITAMLVSSASKGFAKSGKPAGYRIAGKTGTSQISKGKTYETGTGSTFATYAGYAPVEHPRFVVLVKIDRPKNAVHGATAAAPVFKEIATFLFKYYDIPPDDRR
jgi:cell division protein FtsI/penicillin-binding protein 2